MLRDLHLNRSHIELDHAVETPAWSLTPLTRTETIVFVGARYKHGECELLYTRDMTM